jgi:hypothetical protein
VGLLGLVKRSGVGAESKEIRVGVSTCCGVSTQRDNAGLGLFRFA